MKEKKRGVVTIQTTDLPADFFEAIASLQVDLSAEAAQAELDRIAALGADGLPEWPGLANEMRIELSRLRGALTGSPMTLPAVIFSALELGRLEWELAANRQLLKPQEQFLARREHGRNMGQSRAGQTRLDFPRIESEARRLLQSGKPARNITSILIGQHLGEETAIRNHLRKKGIIPRPKRKPV